MILEHVLNVQQAQKGSLNVYNHRKLWGTFSDISIQGHFIDFLYILYKIAI